MRHEIFVCDQRGQLPRFSADGAKHSSSSNGTLRLTATRCCAQPQRSDRVVAGQV